MLWYISSRMTNRVVISLVGLSLLSVARCFYLPGLAAVNYCSVKEQTERCPSEVPVFVNRLTSTDSIVPYEYDHFDFCEADSTDASPPVENLGQIVFGERIRSSPYKFNFEPNGESTQMCKTLCKKSYKKHNGKFGQKYTMLKKAIYLDYRHHFIVDNMPVTLCVNQTGGTNSQVFCSNSFPVGCYVDPKGRSKGSCNIGNIVNLSPNTFYLYNHLDFTVTYHSGKHEDWSDHRHGGEGVGGRIIRIDVFPRSIRHPDDKLDCSPNQPPMVLPSDGSAGQVTLQYSYSVVFRENNAVKWSSRWDYLLSASPGSNIQWFSIVNSLVIVLFLSAMLAMILVRTLHKDIARYNQLDAGDFTQEEFGWKLVHGDVFRPPRHGLLLSVFVGSGMQVVLMAVITLVFACLGFLSPANRGSLMTCGLVLYVCLGTPAGYVSARLYKSFHGDRWVRNILLTSILAPGVVFLITLLLNFVLWQQGSSGALPFLTILALMCLWFGISVPLTFVGAYFGYKKRSIEHPVRTNQIPRQIPEQTLYKRPLPSIVMGGVLPFGCIFVQMFFILNSIWSNEIYYMFGFLFVVVCILVITCAQTTVLLCYFHLCSEDYRWWWRSFLTSGSTALYLFFYCCHYYVVKLGTQDITSDFLYFGYTAIMVYLFFLMCGTFGFLACFWFVRKIYSVVKVD